MAHLTFNGKPLPSFVKITGRSVPASASFSLESAQMGDIGSLYLKTKLEPKEITYNFLIRNKDGKLLDMLDELDGWLTGDNMKPSKLILADQPSFYYWANAEGSSSVDDDFYTAQGSITFKMLNPIKYSVNAKTQEGVKEVIVDYKGTKPAWPTYTITLAANASKITLANGPTSLELIGTFKAGNIIKVDTNGRKVLLNDVVNMSLLSFNSSWVLLNKGKNIIRLNTDDTLKIEYEEGR